MKKLRYISLFIDNEFRKIDDDFYKKFYYNLNFINRYLDVAVRKLKIETPYYNMFNVFIHPYREECDNHYLPGVTTTLITYIRFTEDDMRYLESLADHKQRFEYYLKLLERGYYVAVKNGHTELPIDALLQIHQHFRDGGYKCEWLWKKKLLSKDNMYLFFNIHFTPFYINVELVVMDKKKTTLRCHEELVRRTPFYESIWYDFRNLEIIGNEIVVTDFLDNVFLSIDLRALIKDNIIVTYYDEYFITEQSNDKKIIDKITW